LTASSSVLKVMTGENRLEGNVIQPVLLKGITPEMRIYREEMFAPVRSALACVKRPRRAVPSSGLDLDADGYLSVRRARNAERVKGAVDDALSKGAQIVAGENRLEGNVIQPVLLKGSVVGAGLGRGRVLVRQEGEELVRDRLVDDGGLSVSIVEQKSSKGSGPESFDIRSAAEAIKFGGLFHSNTTGLRYLPQVCAMIDPTRVEPVKLHVKVRVSGL
jgi:hypothetical protein